MSRITFFTFEGWAHSHMGRALVAYYEASGNPRVLQALEKVYSNFALVPVPLPVSECNNVDPMLATYENVRIPAMMYPWTNRPELLTASERYLDWIDKNNLLPFGIASAEEQLAGICSTRNTETCNVAASAWLFFFSKGIDYQFKIYLNQKLLWEQEGMFTYVNVDLTDNLQENTENVQKVFPPEAYYQGKN